jgi:hypothetical protein
MSLFTNATTHKILKTKLRGLSPRANYTHKILKFINCELIFGRSLSLRGALCKNHRIEVLSFIVIFKN